MRQPILDNRHDYLGRNNPAFAFAIDDKFGQKLIKFNEWRPKHFERKRHGAHHDDAKFLVGEILFEDDWYGAEK